MSLNIAGHEQPQPWLKNHFHLNGVPTTNKNSSFIEYLRWMRAKSDDKQIDSGTLLDLLKRFESNDFSAFLNHRNTTTKQLVS
jgi:CRISPR-associated protein Cmr6